MRCKVFLIAAVVVLAPVARADDAAGLFTDCTGAATVPAALKETHAKFAAAARTGSPEEFCLPQAVELTTEKRPENSREYGPNRNRPFLKNGFSAPVYSARKDADDCWLLRTGTPAIEFVKTATGGGKIYRYMDKPIQ